MSFLKRGAVVPRGQRPMLRVSSVLLAIAAGACGNGVDDAGDGAALSQQVQQSDPSDPVAIEGGRVRQVASPWPEGACDEVYEIRAHGPEGADAPFRIPAGGEVHPQIYFDVPWGNEPGQVAAWRAIQDNPKVVHHWIVWQGQVSILGWAPGGSGVPDLSEFASELPGDQERLRLDMHYYNLQGSTDQFDRSGVVICVVRGKNLRSKVTALHLGFNIFAPVMVPANTRNHDLEGSCKVRAQEPVTLLGMSPHAHTRARHMKLTVEKPDGRKIVLHDAGYSFYEQLGYTLNPPFILEDGDKVHVLCRYDNASNRSIGWGESTEDEMCVHWTNYYPKGSFTCGPIVSVR